MIDLTCTRINLDELFNVFKRNRIVRYLMTLKSRCAKLARKLALLNALSASNM